jgi:hypothetical protein
MFKNKLIHKITLEARRDKTFIDYFVTNVKTLNVIQDIRIYRSIGLDSDRYLLCPKVNFPPRGLNKDPKSFSKARRSFLKIRLFNDYSRKWLNRQRLTLHLDNIKTNETNVEKERENLQNIQNSAAYKSLRKIKR